LVSPERESVDHFGEPLPWITQSIPEVNRSCLLAATSAGVAGCVLFVWFVVFVSAHDVSVSGSEQIVVDGVVRTFRMVVPRGRSGERLPVVLHFHGHGNTPESEADRTRLDQLAAAKRFVLVYPAALKDHWSLRSLSSDSADRNRDILFFDALLAHLNTHSNIDRKRVYLMGMSMGAAFVHDLAVARSSVIAAAVAHSASAPSAMDCKRPFPIMMVVGANETPLLSAARQTAQQYRARGHVCELLVVQGIGHEWADARNCQMWQFLARHSLGEHSRKNDESIAPL